jgi:hypothetical protein
MIPAQCKLWKKHSLQPEDLYDLFEEMHVFHENIESSKRLLRCKECDQLYLYEFTGSAEGSGMHIEYYPTRKLDAVLELDAAGIPRLEVRWPAGAEQPSVGWVRE